MKFFVEIDRETIKQIAITMQPGPVFHAQISLLLDRGREAGVSTTALKGKRALRKFLTRQDVPEEAIVAELGEEPSAHRPVWHVYATSFACVILLGGSFVVARYYL